MTISEAKAAGYTQYCAGPYMPHEKHLLDKALATYRNIMHCVVRIGDTAQIWRKPAPPIPDPYIEPLDNRREISVPGYKRTRR